MLSEQGPTSKAADVVKAVQTNATGSDALLDVTALKNDGDAASKRIDKLEEAVAQLGKTTVRQGTNYYINSSAEGGDKYAVAEYNSNLGGAMKVTTINLSSWPSALPREKRSP
jgi:hypothetical protein